MLEAESGSKALLNLFEAWSLSLKKRLSEFENGSHSVAYS
jgi:hypothetical protein